MQLQLGVGVLHDEIRADVLVTPDCAAQVGGVGFYEERDVLRHLAAEQQADAANEQVLLGVVLDRVLEPVALELPQHTQLEIDVVVDRDLDLGSEGPEIEHDQIDRAVAHHAHHAVRTDARELPRRGLRALHHLPAPGPAP